MWQLPDSSMGLAPYVRRVACQHSIIFCPMWLRFEAVTVRTGPQQLCALSRGRADSATGPMLRPVSLATCEAVEKIVDLAAEDCVDVNSRIIVDSGFTWQESTNSIGVGFTPGSVVDPHEAAGARCFSIPACSVLAREPWEVTCHDRGYIIKTLTNFSCTPVHRLRSNLRHLCWCSQRLSAKATWTLPNTLLLLRLGWGVVEARRMHPLVRFLQCTRPDSDVLFTECEFARGSTSWSPSPQILLQPNWQSLRGGCKGLSFHTYLNEEFKSPGKALP